MLISHHAHRKTDWPLLAMPMLMNPPAAPSEAAQADARRVANSIKAAAIGRAKRTEKIRRRDGGDIRAQIRLLVMKNPGIDAGTIADKVIRKMPTVERRRVHLLLTKMADEFRREGYCRRYRYFMRKTK